VVDAALDRLPALRGTRQLRGALKCRPERRASCTAHRIARSWLPVVPRIAPRHPSQPLAYGGGNPGFTSGRVKATFLWMSHTMNLEFLLWISFNRKLYNNWRFLLERRYASMCSLSIW
jgi:hypothetical protein